MSLKMHKIKVTIKRDNQSYPIFIGCSIIYELSKFLKRNYPSNKVVIITDDVIKSIFAIKIAKLIKKLDAFLITVSNGEKSKSRKIKEQIEDALLKKKLGRDTVIIAFGGGVIGDLAGFVASTYNRGVPIVQVPTTFLSMVDSSIGGKTSVNTKHGKNLIGAFYQPSSVFIDLDFLLKLPKQEFINGLCETLKISITSDRKFFNYILKNHREIISKKPDVLMHLIKKSILLKLNAIKNDETESNLRQVVNFGHTYGHALETISNFKIKHGFCVIYGMIVESKISELLGFLPESERKQILFLFAMFGLPVRIDKNTGYNGIFEIMKIDKKSKGQRPRFVILKKIGKVRSEENNYSFEVKESMIKKAIETCAND
jgi:3-dehydroquinate synthase